MPEYNTFIVRIWSNDNDGLHGQITHVASQERRDFRELRRMVDFIVEHVGNPEGTQEAFQEKDQNRGET